MDAEPRKKIAAFVVVNLVDEGGINKFVQQTVAI